MSKFAIRRALEAELNNAPGLSGIQKVMGGDKRNTAGVEEYLLTGISFGEDRATEIGPNPRIERAGRFRIGVFTPVAYLEDRNDQLAGLVRAVYPYAMPDLEWDGIRVSILTTDDGQCVIDGSFFFSPVYVNFMVWSTTNA